MSARVEYEVVFEHVKCAGGCGHLLTHYTRPKTGNYRGPYCIHCDPRKHGGRHLRRKDAR